MFWWGSCSGAKEPGERYRPGEWDGGCADQCPWLGSPSASPSLWRDLPQTVQGPSVGGVPAPGPECEPGGVCALPLSHAHSPSRLQLLPASKAKLQASR